MFFCQSLLYSNSVLSASTKRLSGCRSHSPTSCISPALNARATAAPFCLLVMATHLPMVIVISLDRESALVCQNDCFRSCKSAIWIQHLMVTANVNVAASGIYSADDRYHRSHQDHSDLRLSVRITCECHPSGEALFEYLPLAIRVR